MLCTTGWQEKPWHRSVVLLMSHRHATMFLSVTTSSRVNKRLKSEATTSAQKKTQRCRFSVPPGETIETEVGSFVLMHPAMTTNVELKLCVRGGWDEEWSRIWSGESCVKVFLNNDFSEHGYVVLTHPTIPSRLFPLNSVSTPTRTPPSWLNLVRI